MTLTLGMEFTSVNGANYVKTYALAKKSSMFELEGMNFAVLPYSRGGFGKVFHFAITRRLEVVIEIPGNAQQYSKFDCFLLVCHC
jgi:hypothetical protein